MRTEAELKAVLEEELRQRKERLTPELRTLFDAVTAYMELQVFINHMQHDPEIQTR